MKRIEEIRTANFTEVRTLLKENYICVSVIGKVYGDYDGKEEIQRIRSLNTFRHFYHLKAKDYHACYILYKEILEHKGIDRLKSDLIQLTRDNNKSKIAFCGYGRDDEFCYRYILSDFLQSNGVNVEIPKEIDLSYQKSLWNIDLYKSRGHYNLSNFVVGDLLEYCEWVFAKTMPKNPHYYTLRKTLEDDSLFLKLVSHIRYFGRIESYEGMAYRVFYFNNTQYWTMPQDITNEQCDLINKKYLG